jgi:hypothetical protein
MSPKIAVTTAGEDWRTAMGKVSLALGFGVGYVLGARAGRERYEQIVQSASEFMGRPEVQQALEQAKAAAPAPLQGSIDKLTQGTSGGQSAGTTGTSTSGTGTSGTGTSGTGTSGTGTSGTSTSGTGTSGTTVLDAGTLDVAPLDAGTLDVAPLDAGTLDVAPLDAAPLEAEVIGAEAAVLDEGTVVVTPPPPATGTADAGGSDAAVPDPLVPPAKSKGSSGKR